MKVTFTFQDGLIQSFPIKSKTFLIGRSPSCAVCVKGQELSREHCRVDIDQNQAVWITDLASSNGVYIDGKLIRPNIRTKYALTQQLHMGDCYVVFDLSSAELTRSLVNIRPLLQSEGQAEVTKIRSYKKQAEQLKKEKTSSTVLTLIAWGILLTGTFFLANSAFEIL